MQEAVDNKEKPKVNKVSGFDPAAFGCLRCGKKTNPPHEARSCPTPKAGLVCSYCGMQESHVADVCFKKLVAEGKMAPKRPEAGGKSQSPAGGAQSPAGGRSQSPAGGHPLQVFPSSTSWWFRGVGVPRAQGRRQQRGWRRRGVRQQQQCRQLGQLGWEFSLGGKLRRSASGCVRRIH